LDEKTENQNSLYWLWPFKNYKTFCPYLVGSYEQVAAEIAKYIRAGFSNFILDIPAAEEDVHKAGIVFREAVKRRAVQ
jgi:alkanesulfonate monooxygenase